MQMLLNSTIAKVFKHVYASYKKVHSVWIGFLSKFIDNFTNKCLLSILFAKLIVALVGGDDKSAFTEVMLILAVLISTAIINSLGDYYFVKNTDEQYKVLAGEFHSKLLAKDVAYFERESVGKLNTLFRDHLDGTIRVIRLMRGEVLSFLSALFFPVLALLFYDAKIAFLILIIGIVELSITNWIANKVKSLRKEGINVYKILTGEVTDQILNITVVKASGREDAFKQSVVNLAAQEEALFGQRHKYESFTEFIKNTIIAFGICLTLWFIMTENISAKETMEISVIAILYLLQINSAISNFPDLFKKFYEHIDRVHVTLPILSASWESIRKFSSNNKIVQSSDVIFDNVDYSYRNESGGFLTKVFERFNLHIKAGSHCAVMGKSGVGKSTLAHLLMRFDDVTGGRILLGGNDIRNYQVKLLRESLSYVPSQPILFNRTIRENIILYSPNASQEEIVSACECAQAHEFISKMEKGYETLVSERGGNLSAGQKQRIAIARALLKNEAKIFIFDEITSALDEDSADNLVTKIKERLSNKTVFFMTHSADVADKMDYRILIHAIPNTF